MAAISLVSSSGTYTVKVDLVFIITLFCCDAYKHLKIHVHSYREVAQGMELHKHSQIQLLMWGSSSSSGLGLACDPEDPGSIPG